jgi:choline kinase
MLGVIAAAGEGSRWGRFEKELLPIGPEQWLIDNSLEAMRLAGARRICLVSSPAKIHTHANHFMKEKYRRYDIFYVIQRERTDIWGAIKESFPFAEDLNLFAMPDTLFDPQCFRTLLARAAPPPFSLGTFDTQRPERFGVLHGGRVVNKSTDLPAAQYSAWGTLVWSREVVDAWLADDPRDYTLAINRAIERFGHGTFPLNYYYDFAAWADYKRWLGEWQPDPAETNDDGAALVAGSAGRVAERPGTPDGEA